jgi:hypothetical protein
MEKIIEEFIKKIEDAKINSDTDEWTKGFNGGLEWAIRILKKDKAAY